MTRRARARCLLACCLLLALAACGNKGPLYLPEEDKVEKKDSVDQSDSETE